MFICELSQDYGDNFVNAVGDSLMDAWLMEEGITGTDGRNVCTKGNRWYDGHGYRGWASKRVVLTSDQVVQLSALDGWSVKVVAKIGHGSSKPVDVAKLAASKNAEQLATSGQSNTYNDVCHVHVPGQALSVYNEVMLLEDSCTDALQTALTKGWRIIAACPQPDQRRPDYIMGRFNPEQDICESARRRA